MKKISIIAGIILCLHLIFAPIMTAQAATNETLADDTLYYETVIEETASFSPMASNTAKTKTIVERPVYFIITFCCCLRYRQNNLL